MIRLVTLSGSNMTLARGRLAASAVLHGADIVTTWDYADFALTDFYQQNEKICRQPKGMGFWIWKPYILNQAITEMREGDFLIYVDAGVQIIDNLKYMIDRMDQDIWLFGNEWFHFQWCKADIIGEILPGIPWESFGRQAQASAMCFRVNDYTRNFIREWLEWCTFEEGRLIDDSPSRIPNHPDFRENRYDQAILSTLAHREGIRLHGWFVRYPTFEPRRTEGYEQDDYPVLFLHHRWRNHEWQEGVLA